MSDPVIQTPIVERRRVQAWRMKQAQLTTGVVREEAESMLLGIPLRVVTWDAKDLGLTPGPKCSSAAFVIWRLSFSLQQPAVEIIEHDSAAPCRVLGNEPERCTDSFRWQIRRHPLHKKKDLG